MRRVNFLTSMKIRAPRVFVAVALSLLAGCSAECGASQEGKKSLAEGRDRPATYTYSDAGLFVHGPVGAVRNRPEGYEQKKKEPVAPKP